MQVAEVEVEYVVRPILKGHKTLIVGIANDQSIATAARKLSARPAPNWPRPG